MAARTINLFINIQTQQLVSVNGSPTSVPDIYYGDIVTFNVFGVQPAANPANIPTPVNLTGNTMNLTMAGAPNATSPPTPFASFDNAAYSPSLLTINSVNYGGYILQPNMTNGAVGAFIGPNPSAIAYINFDIYDAGLNRQTLYQDKFTVKASIDSVTFIPGPPGATTLTVQQALATFLQIAPFPGKQCLWQSPTTGIKVQQTCDDTGAERWDRVNVP